MKHCIMMFILCIMTIVCLAEDRYIEQRCDKCNNELVKCSMCKGRGYDLSNRQCKKCRGEKTQNKQCSNCKSTGKIKIKIDSDYNNPTNVILRRWKLDKRDIPEIIKILNDRKLHNEKTNKMCNMMLIRYSLHDYSCKFGTKCVLDPVILKKYYITNDYRDIDSIAAYMVCQKEDHCDLCGNSYLMLKFEYKVFQVIDSNTLLVKSSCRSVVHGVNPTHVVNMTWAKLNTFDGDIVKLTFTKPHNFTDGDLIKDTHWFKYVGPSSYESILGAKRTVRSFVELSNVGY